MSLLLYENIKQLVTLAGVARKEGRHIADSDLGVIENGAMVINTDTNKIEWVGETAKLPDKYSSIPNVYSGEDEIWLPELVECHTHLIYAGERVHDFSERMRGKTYQEIAAGGGGILTTLKHTREASHEELLTNAKLELERFSQYGIGTVEIKSGYGLSLESEIKCLEVIRDLKPFTSVHLVPTFLPAHAVPPEFKGRADDFVQAICNEWIPEVSKRKLARYFDAFIEQGFFSVTQSKKMFEKAKEAGFEIKVHADQFTALGGTELAIEFGAHSVDHLEQATNDGIKALANSKTVAVLCPGASLFTKTAYAPARKLIDAGARVAISTDFNPGTCPSRNLPLMTTIACTQMGLTVAEAIGAVTYNAAAALGLEKEIGSLEVGKLFRTCQLKASSFEALPYCFGELN